MSKGACVPMGGGGIVCYETCWACKFDNCYDEPTWHTWADQDDIEYALDQGHTDPSTQRCACDCAKAEPVTA
jgi:hypothetical protein